jgi:hypothetical protein
VSMHDGVRSERSCGGRSLSSRHTVRKLLQAVLILFLIVSIVVVYPAKLPAANALVMRDRLTLNTRENNLRSAVIDPSGYAYFGTHTSPGKIVKVSLSDFTRSMH